MNNKIFWISAIILGIIFLLLAVVYWITPASSLPAFVPGHEAGVSKTHFKHGIGSLFLSLGLFAYAWFQSGKKKSTSHKEEK